MWSAIFNCWKVPELRTRILFTAGIIVLARMASSIPCPGIDSIALHDYMTNKLSGNAVGGMLTMMSMFSGGALEQFSIAALGIMPYITASIILQLVTPAIPALEKLKREGEPGQQKMNQYTRYLTLAICVIQGSFAAWAIMNPTQLQLPAADNSLVLNIFDPSGALDTFSVGAFIVMTTLVLSAGSMMMVWLGDRVTEKGLGNGASIIITIGILARFPKAIQELYQRIVSDGANHLTLANLLIIAVMFVVVTAFTVMLTQGTRQVPIQMARKMVGTGRGATGTTTYLPLKVNFSGVMPIIFGSALLQIPSVALTIIPQFFSNFETQQMIAGWRSYFQYGEPTYMLIYGLMIVIFSYFWVANMFNPGKMSDYLKNGGSYIPGIAPGKPTAAFLDSTMSRLTFAGAFMLTALAILPMILGGPFNLGFNVSQFFGGTSLLICVGVVLDTLNKMESYLVMRNYDGFLKTGRIHGRQGNFSM